MVLATSMSFSQISKTMFQLRYLSCQAAHAQELQGISYNFILG